MSVAASSYSVAPTIESRRAWEDLQAWLPAMLDELLASEVYGRANRPPREQRGVYLFSDGEGRHQYVGRTGITARSRLAGSTPSTSFRARFDQHTQDGRPPWSAPFAMRLAREEAALEDLDVPTAWWRHRTDHPQLHGLFTAAKRRIADEMQMRIVAFDDDIKGIRSTVAETYVHALLRTTYNDFSPS